MEDAVRQLVRVRAAARCEYCRMHENALPWAPFHVEHVRARQHGGNDHLDNLAFACRRCNLRKGPNLSSVDPDSDNIVRLYNPRIDNWHEHFALFEFRIVGLTDVGRATVVLLDMNDLDRIQLRAELTALGIDVV